MLRKKSKYSLKTTIGQKTMKDSPPPKKERKEKKGTKNKGNTQ